MRRLLWIFSIYVTMSVRNHIVEDTTQDKGPVNKGGQNVEEYYAEGKGQGTSWDSHGAQQDKGGDYGAMG